MSVWIVTTKSVERRVEAIDQHAAWNTLRQLPFDQFGLVVSANREGGADRDVVHTAALFLAWSRDQDAAYAFEALGHLGLSIGPIHVAIRGDVEYAHDHGRPDINYCEECGMIFFSSWTEEEAMAEYKAAFPEAGAPQAVVCESCYRKLSGRLA